MSNTLIDWGRMCKCMHLISKTSLICIYYHFDPYILQDDLLLDGEFSKKLNFRNFFFPGISRGHRVFHSYFTQVKITQFSGNGSTFVHTNNNLLTWLLSPVCYVPTLNTHRTFLSRESPTPTEDPLHIVLYAKIVDKNPISSVLLRCHFQPSWYSGFWWVKTINRATAWRLHILFLPQTTCSEETDSSGTPPSSHTSPWSFSCRHNSPPANQFLSENHGLLL